MALSNLPHYVGLGACWGQDLRIANADVEGNGRMGKALIKLLRFYGFTVITNYRTNYILSRHRLHTCPMPTCLLAYLPSM